MVRAPAIALALALATAASAQDSKTSPSATQATKAAVDACVAQVRSLADSQGLDATFFREFDAYYSAGNRKIYTNTTRVGDERPTFVFWKCMSESGFSRSE